MAYTSSQLTATWTQRIQEWKSSGQSIASWCKERDLPEHQFYYWNGRLNPKESKKSPKGFHELVDAELLQSGVSVSYNGAEIKLARHFDRSTLVNCLSVLREGIPC